MRSSIVLFAAAIAAVSAQDPCRDTYNSCVAAGTPELVCTCALASCLGEDNARNREYCATATIGLVTASATASAPIVTGTIAPPPGAPQINAPAGSIPLGQPCGADEQCGAGVQCWGSTASTIRTCGSFNAACTTDSQCAFNTCNNGLCSGFLPSSAYPANTRTTSSASSATSTAEPTTSSVSSASATTTSTASTVTGTIVQPSGAPQITAPAGSVPLGQPCGADEQCGAGVQCWGSTASTIRTCGSFNAACTTDSQCAFNTCNNGLCSGFLPSSDYPAATPSIATNNTTTIVAPTGTIRPTSTLTPYTGAAPAGASLSGLAALIAGVAACFL